MLDMAGGEFGHHEHGLTSRGGTSASAWTKHNSGGAANAALEKYSGWREVAVGVEESFLADTDQQGAVGVAVGLAQRAVICRFP